MKKFDWQKRLFLNNEIVYENCCDLHPALNENDLKNIIVENAIILEKVYRDELFEKFYDFLKFTNEHIMFLTTNDIKSYFNFNSKIFKILKRNNSKFYQMYVCVSDFTNEDIFIKLKILCKDKISNDRLIEKTKEIKNEILIHENINGFFTHFENNNFFGLMFLKPDFSLNTLCHEFIHYLNWISKGDIDETEADTDFYSNEVQLINRYINESFFEKTLSYVSKSTEYETLLNDFCELMKQIKERYFYNLSGYDFAKFISNNVTVSYSHNGTELFDRESYLLNLKGLSFFNEVKNKTAFLMIIFYVLIQERVINIKNHIFGYFK